jgi:hypothetical protein
MDTEAPLDVFGRFIMENLRDRGIDCLDRRLAAHCKAPSVKDLQRDLGALAEAQRALVRRAFIDAFDSAIHDFLFALQEQYDNRGPIRVRVSGKDVASLSDGLHGELFTEDGWYARFSAHGEPPETA